MHMMPFEMLPLKYPAQPTVAHTGEKIKVFFYVQGSSARIDDDKTGKEKSDILLHSTRKKRSRGGFPGCQSGYERSTVECVPRNGAPSQIIQRCSGV